MIRRKTFMLAAACSVGLAIWLSAVATADSTTASPSLQGIDNETCLACHSRPDLRITLASGEPLYLTVDAETYDSSVHGQMGYACVQCHTDITGFPHEPVTATSRRDFVLQRYRASCVECHEEAYLRGLDSVHQQALAAGNNEAAVCTDCHGAHDVQPAGESRTGIVQTCETCHSEVYALYRESVHGAALLGEGNPDVPTCTDCHEVHGEHEIAGPSTGEFRLYSPQICAECHADAAMMNRYGISTDVFDTYVSDFHGTTVQLFQEVTPDQETNKPVCIDCHGVHDMKQVDDPESKVIKENLLVTCQKCHPDATANFPESWTSHYVPSPEENRLVYYVNGFYNWFFIPVVVGGMTAYVGLDGVRRIINRRKERRHD